MGPQKSISGSTTVHYVQINRIEVAYVQRTHSRLVLALGLLGKRDLGQYAFFDREAVQPGALITARSLEEVQPGASPMIAELQQSVGGQL